MLERDLPINVTLARVLTWSGPVLIVAMIIAQGFLMGFIPPPSPALGAEELKTIFVENQGGIKLGSLIQCICWSFWATWAIPILTLIRRMERGRAPMLTWASIANVGGGYVFFLLIPMTWAVIAFRSETLPANIVQIMNDWVWFDFLFTWPPFSVWMVIIAVAVFMDRSVPTVYPRWVGYFNLWTALLIVPAGLIVFFKQGPFAYDGFISFWFAFFVFFGWMCTMTVVTLRALKAEERQQRDDAMPAIEREPESVPA